MTAWLRRALALVLGAALAVAGMLVYQDNVHARAAFTLFGWRSGDVPLFWWLAGAVTLGLVAGLLLALPALVRLRLRARALERALAAARAGTGVPPAGGPRTS
jgi:amino acid transporter